MISVDPKNLYNRISYGHRLVRLAHQNNQYLYSKNNFYSKAILLSADNWLDYFMAALRERINESVIKHTCAAIERAKLRSNVYEINKLGIAEHITEVFFDRWWFNTKETDLSRKILRNHIQHLIDRKKCLRLYFPFFSRKPLCPLKNRGIYPDLAEIHSLARCAEVARTINKLSPTGCQFIILADGFKYSRACKTPDIFISSYQKGLSFWINCLGVNDLVHLVNYEQWVRESIDSLSLGYRTKLYDQYYKNIAKKYNPFFNPRNLERSLTSISKIDSIGSELCFIFWSIVTSVYYPDIFQKLSENLTSHLYDNDESQQLYLHYISSLNYVIDEYKQNCVDLFYTLRQQAWDATIRYISISLADKEIDVLKKIDPDLIKLTIHPKTGEIHFCASTHQNITMTAQHSTGGLTLSKHGLKINFQYRLEREARGEFPLLIEKMVNINSIREKYGILYDMQKIGQPICYCTNKTDIDLFHRPFFMANN